jgi:AraC family transcriptional regulator of adaptative response/methylated-DNA-[protein]-cysteine methyltransferase
MKTIARSIPVASTLGAIRFGIGKTFLGSALVAWSDKGVCAIFFDRDRDAMVDELQRRFPGEQVVPAAKKDRAMMQQILGIIESPEDAVKADLNLDPRGTDFQRRVWAELRKIPAGKTASYSEVARRIGSPAAVRAVAGACAANSLAIVIPCHRVVRQDGGLSGFRWGADRKKALLEKEAAR